MVVVEAVQVAVLVAGGAAARLGRPPAPGWRRPSLASLLGTVAFAGIGLLLAGTLRGEVNLAAANGLYLVLLLLGGMVIPLDRLPGALRALAKCLPSAALSEAFRGALTPGLTVPGWTWVTLAAWAVLAPVVAARCFRWE